MELIIDNISFSPGLYNLLWLKCMSNPNLNTYLKRKPSNFKFIFKSTNDTQKSLEVVTWRALDTASSVSILVFDSFADQGLICLYINFKKGYWKLAKKNKLN